MVMFLGPVFVPVRMIHRIRSLFMPVIVVVIIVSMRMLMGTSIVSMKVCMLLAEENHE